MLLSMNEGRRFTFGKDERLRGEKRIESLFVSGQSFVAYPLRVVYLETPSASSGVSALISIPKKRIRSAVKRNRMKRLVRESYRLNKHLLDTALLPADHRLDVAFVYTKDEISDYALVEKGMQKALKELSRKLNFRRKQNGETS